MLLPNALRKLMNTLKDWFVNDNFKPTTTWGHFLHHSGLLLSVLYYNDFQFHVIKGDLWYALFCFVIMIIAFLCWRHTIKTHSK